MSMPVTQNLISILMQESHYILLAIPQGWTSNERKQLTFQPGRITKTGEFTISIKS